MTANLPPFAPITPPDGTTALEAMAAVEAATGSPVVLLRVLGVTVVLTPAQARALAESPEEEAVMAQAAAILGAVQ